MAGRAAAWFGKGIHGSLRDAILADSPPPGPRCRVFGMHRAGDTAGAVAGPLLGWLILMAAAAAIQINAEPLGAVSNHFSGLADSWAAGFRLHGFSGEGEARAGESREEIVGFAA
jgi:hypothetical protein